MDWEDLTLLDVQRLVKALEQASTDPTIVRAVIDRIQAEPIDHGRVTIGSVRRLLAQTNGSTVLSDEVVTQLNTPEPTLPLLTTAQRARTIMGVNFFGIEETIQHFGVIPTEQQLAALAVIPFDEATLEAYKDIHALVAVLPLSILDMRQKAPRAFYNQGWYTAEAFAADKGETGWQLVSQTPVPDSMAKTWDEQQALLSTDEETPSAQVMVTAIIGHFLATGKRLFEREYVRTSSLGSGGHRIHVGNFVSPHGLDVNGYFDDACIGRLAVASARKA